MHLTYEQFIQSLKQDSPPDISDELKSLWYDGRGFWEKAHEVIQVKESPSHCLIHAYLHRKEGDIWNADYWYRRAGEKRKDWSLEEEWEALVHQFVN